MLTPESLTDLTPSKLAAVEPDESTASSVGKLILGDAWYYAAVLDAQDAQGLQEGEQLTLRFAKNVERDLSVTVESVSKEEDGRVAAVFEGRTYLPQLTLLRQQSAQIIERSITGLRIPKEALRAEWVRVDSDGERTTEQETGVYCLVGAEACFKPVEVLYDGDDFVLVRSTFEDAVDTTSTQEKQRLRPGDEVIITANDLYDGKVID